MAVTRASVVIYRNGRLAIWEGDIDEHGRLTAMDLKTPDGRHLVATPLAFTKEASRAEAEPLTYAESILFTVKED